VGFLAQAARPQVLLWRCLLFRAKPFGFAEHGSCQPIPLAFWITDGLGRGVGEAISLRGFTRAMAQQRTALAAERSGARPEISAAFWRRDALSAIDVARARRRT